MPCLWQCDGICNLEPSPRCAVYRVSAFQSSAEFAILVFQMFANGHITWKIICKCVIAVRRSDFPVPVVRNVLGTGAVDDCSGHSKKSYRLSQCGIGNRLRHSLGHVLNKHRKKRIPQTAELFSEL